MADDEMFLAIRFRFDREEVDVVLIVGPEPADPETLER